MKTAARAIFLRFLISGTVLICYDALGHEKQQHELGSETTTAEFNIERLTVPTVTLKDHHGVEHDFPGSLTEKKMVVINFSYTNCESICPMGNYTMSQLDSLIPDTAPVLLLSVTIDPARDTPSQMRRVAEDFNASEKWYWLTGAVGEVKQLLSAFDADSYNIELHDPIFLIGSLATGHFYRSLSMPSAKELAALVSVFNP